MAVLLVCSRSEADRRRQLPFSIGPDTTTAVTQDSFWRFSSLGFSYVFFIVPPFLDVCSRSGRLPVCDHGSKGQQAHLPSGRCAAAGNQGERGKNDSQMFPRDPTAVDLSQPARPCLGWAEHGFGECGPGSAATATVAWLAYTAK